MEGGSSSSPLDGQPRGEQGNKEQTPDAPQPEQTAQQEPESPKEDKGLGENRDTQVPPPQGEKGRVELTDSSERWGDLPIHVRDIFRTEGGGNMPPQYRDWIDAYYKRLNQGR